MWRNVKAVALNAMLQLLVICRWSFSFFFSFNWNVDKVTSLITYAYLKKNYSHWNDNWEEPTSSNALSITKEIGLQQSLR